jgi:hypothetical protein
MFDLSPDAVRAGVIRLGGPPLTDAHDERHLSSVERRLRVELEQVELHRRSPRQLLSALDLSVYDRPYAPPDQRADARARHLAAWPAAIEAALSSPDLVPAPAAERCCRRCVALGRSSGPMSREGTPRWPLIPAW